MKKTVNRSRPGPEDKVESLHQSGSRMEDKSIDSRGGPGPRVSDVWRIARNDAWTFPSKEPPMAVSKEAWTAAKSNSLERRT